MPVAVAPRVAHVRVPEPFAVHEALAAAGDEPEARARMLAGMHARLQRGVDGLRDEFADGDVARARPNSLYSGTAPR